MTLEIRPVRPEEYEAVGAIVIAAYDREGTIEGPYRAQIRDTGARVDAGAAVLVAVDGPDLLGSVTYVEAGQEHFENAGAGDCGFRMLGVATSAQGRGVGRALVQACLDRGRRDGHHRVAIYTMEWMDTARRMYERMGFVRRPDRDVVFPAGVGHALQYDLTAQAAEHFDPPGPVPERPPWYEDAWAAHNSST
ncbi:GNAT family N-acetyltransferase [Euzebya tangerina]|uniref:GNAT family N-acetyltransferase n=1 Tax=Euzebya tangerina TaxID=591198 RepID=UPI000E30CD2A|nr:GNAT family N-acetyltransferase [Euzebya tangerina]